MGDPDVFLFSRASPTSAHTIPPTPVRKYEPGIAFDPRHEPRRGECRASLPFRSRPACSSGVRLERADCSAALRCGALQAGAQLGQRLCDLFIGSAFLAIGRRVCSHAPRDGSSARHALASRTAETNRQLRVVTRSSGFFTKLDQHPPRNRGSRAELSVWDTEACRNFRPRNGKASWTSSVQPISRIRQHPVQT